MASSPGAPDRDQSSNEPKSSRTGVPGYVDSDSRVSFCPVTEIPDYIAADEAAREAFLLETTCREALRDCAWAVFWAVVFAMTIVGEGYDLALMGNFFSFRHFQKLFGTPPRPDSPLEIPALWQSLIQCATLIGQIIAVYLSGIALDRFGFRKTVMTALVFVMLFLLVSFFSPEALKVGGSDAALATLLAGEFLLGLPWGVFQASVLPYASEIAPMPLRPILTTFVNMCWIFGQLLSTGAIKAVSGFESSLLAFRVPMALQWLWPLPVATLVFFAPESPWWLVRHGRSDEALRVIKRLDKDATLSAGTLRIMELTNQHEKQKLAKLQDVPRTSDQTGSVEGAETGNDGKTSSSPTTQGNISFMDCFRDTNRRRTEVVAMLNLTQQLCGSCLMFYSAKLYQKGGVSAEQAFNYTLIQYGLGIVAIVCSWFLLERLPRRIIWLAGVSGSACLMIAVGVLGLFARNSDPTVTGPIPWIIASLLIIFTGVYNCTIGPLAYSLGSEMPSTRLKAKTVIIGRSVYLVSGFFNLFLTPKLLEDRPNGWGLGPSAALVFGGLNLLVFLPWAWFRLPETRNRSFAEIDVLFKSGVPAKKWAETSLATIPMH